MASIKKSTFVPDPPPVHYVLTLTEDEAHALLAITGFVGGPPDTTARGHFDALGEAFREAGLGEWQKSKYYSDVSGSIQFSNHSE